MYFKFLNSLYTPEIVKKLKETIIPEIMNGVDGVRLALYRNEPRALTPTELDCIINNMKTKYAEDPTNINKDNLKVFIKTIIHECLWTTAQVERIKGVILSIADYKYFSNVKLDCIINNLKTKYEDPQYFENKDKIFVAVERILDNCR
jgi:hypothetical protein